MGILDDAATPLTCANCHWWRNFPGGYYGECHRHAPAKLTDEEQCHWPITKSDAYCGDYDAAAK